MKKDNLEEALTDISTLDLNFVVPFFVLFSYLLLEHWWQWMIDIVIVVLCALGAAYLFHTIKKRFNSDLH